MADGRHLRDDLGLVVRSYVPEGDERSYAQVVRLLESDRPVWRRTEFDPGHFTASGFVASPDGTSMLLVLHGKLDRWLQPGGHLEPEDRTVEAAARREVLEETGVGNILRVGDSLVRVDAHPIPERPTEPAHTHFDLGMGFHATSPDIGPIDEIVEARWVRFEDLSDYDVDDALVGGATSLHRLLNHSAG